MQIDRKLLDHVAALARLHLTDKEAEELLPQLDEILQAFSEVQSVDTEGVPPSLHPVPLPGLLREDVPRPCLTQEDALRNEKHQKDGFFKAPRVV